MSTTESDVNTMTVDNADKTVNSDNIRTSTNTPSNTMDTGNVAGTGVPGQTPDNTMNVGNIASESVHEQTTHNIIHTGLNDASENVQEQTPETTINTVNNVATANVHEQPPGIVTHTGSIPSKSVLGQTAHSTMHTGKVIVPADSVTRESVPKQASGNQTAENTTSTVNSSLDQIVTAASEITGTVSGSVHIRRENDELASETVFTSMTVTTVPTSVSSLITTSPVMPTKECEAMLCEKDAGHFVINVTACAANDSPTISTSIPTTLEILTNVNFVSPDILCYWNIEVPEKKIVNVTIDQLMMEEDERNGTQTLDICVENYVNVKRVFNVSVLRARSVSFTSASSLSFRFRGHDLHLPSAITFRFLVQPGSGVQDLPVVWLTDTDGYVTSPGFDGMRGLYPPGYDGTFHLHLLDYQSVFIKFTHFDLEPEDHGKCYDDYLDFRVTAFNQAWRKCGQQDILSRVYRSSIHLFFHADESIQLAGFKMVYAILPRSQGSQELSDNLYRCSSTTSPLPVQPGSVVDNLPVIELTHTLGYVTSPGFNKSDGVYPSDYAGLFYLHLSDGQSVFTSFTHFVLGKGDECRYDYLDFGLTALSQTWRKCGDQDIPPRVYRSSIHLFFHSDDSNQFTGFKMMYAILPRSQEPQQLSDNLYNCSVPHFHSFKPLLSCNIVTECQGNEDEEDCDHHSNECGDGAVDAGTKCYRFVRRGVTTTWDDAYNECSEVSQNLVTLATEDELRRWREITTSVRNPHRVYIGANLPDKWQDVNAEATYKHLWQWVDGRTAFFLNVTGYHYGSKCISYIPASGNMKATRCQQSNKVDVVCEFDKYNAHSKHDTKVNLISSIAIGLDDAVWKVSVVHCPSGHVTRDVLSCDTQGQCGSKQYMTSCQSGSVTLSMFVCERHRETLHYTLVCDHIQHCEDNTDEEFCQYPVCPFNFFLCDSGQCFFHDQFCDLNIDCYDGTDELCYIRRQFLNMTTLPPAVLDVDGTGRPFLRQMKDSDECPVTHFQCSQGYCLPIYLRCNGVDDCPNREDEASCESYTCSGFYRCRGSKVCLPADHVCDGVFQCPQYDDELLCDKQACPDVCQCQGLAFVCTANFSASSYPDLRYLDASGSGMTPSALTRNFLLIHLRLSDCRIDTQSTLELPNLRHLDLSGNELTHINVQQFRSLKNLRVLVLSGNPLSAVSNTVLSEARRMVLETINLSGTNIDGYNGSALASCPNIKTLNLSWNVKLTTITDEGFQSTPLLENLDVRGSPLKDFPSDLLKSLFSLKLVYADNYKLCCEAILPEDFDLNNCHAEQDLLASCNDLLKSNVCRVFLWLFASLSILGNVGSFVIRLYLGNKGSSLGSFSIFVTNLSIADFIMGVYLAIVGVADQVYRGEYLWYDDQWKQSAVCKIAGFLSLMSSEVSAFIICFITLDRFLALRFPFSRLHFSRGSSLIACAVVWVIGIALATVPLLPMALHWEYYSQTGICIPLPFSTSENVQGYDYSFNVMILLSFALFLLIAVGQAIIYWSVRSNSISSSKNTGSRDATIARRLTTIVLSDFLCWFPIGLLGLLASTGTRIPDEINVAVAIFVMPFNSALNPFLYTFNVLMEKRRKAQEAYLLKQLEFRLCTQQTPNESRVLK